MQSYDSNKTRLTDIVGKHNLFFDIYHIQEIHLHRYGAEKQRIITHNQQVLVQLRDITFHNN